jgi:catechol 2,3-dioxygenase
MTTTTRLGHVHLKVRELARSVEFYSHLLGLHMTEQVGDFAFLSFGEAHHDLALQALGAHALAPREHSVGLYHVAFEVPDAQGLLARYDELVRMRIPFVAVDHGISFALYLSDPDGNGVEIYLDTRNRPDGAPEWQGRSRALDRNDIQLLIEPTMATH